MVSCSSYCTMIIENQNCGFSYSTIQILTSSAVAPRRWPKPSLRCKEKTKPIASKRNNCVLVSYVTHWGDCTAHFYFSVFTSKAFLLRAIFHSLLAKLYNPCRSMPHQMTVLLPSVMLWRGKMTNALVARAT